jgi:hypothetical protein
VRHLIVVNIRKRAKGHPQERQRCERPPARLKAPAAEKEKNLALPQQLPGKDSNDQKTDYLRDIYSGVSIHAAYHLRQPAGKVAFGKSETIQRPEQGTGCQPDPIEYQVERAAEGQGQQPNAAGAAVQPGPEDKHDDEKQQGMGISAAVAERFPEDEMAEGFIDNIRKQGTDHQYPDIGVIRQRPEDG